jgi:endonuclease/exonuclease/phosphatase family metal-dependent hydrolase
VDDAVALGSIRFQVYADGALIFDSLPVLGGNMTGAHPGQRVSLDVSGRRELRLYVSDGGNGMGKDHADWADARVTCTPGVLRPLRRTSYLSDLAATSATIGWGTIGKDVSVSKTPLSLNGVVYAKGIGTHAISDIRYALAGACSRFDAVVGVDDAVAVTRGSIRFQVFADGRFLYDSFPAVAGNMTGAHPGQPVSLDVSGAQEIRLLVGDGGNGAGSDHADWGNARVTCTATVPPPPPPPDTTTSYLSNLTPASATIGWGSIGWDVSVGGNPLRLNGVTYAKGIGTHAVSDIRYDLAGRCSRFQAVVGLDDEMTKGSVRFQVVADGTLVYDSFAVMGRNMTAADAGRPVSVDISGRVELRLLVADGGDGIGSDHADWADARITCTATSPLTATFAYWNVFGGNGVPHLAATNYANPAQPFTCRNMAGDPLDDSQYNTGTGAAIRPADGTMTELLVQHIANDPTVVAIGLGESWGSGGPEDVAPILGWSLANATKSNQGDVILTRYGFTEQGFSPAIGQTAAEIHRAVYANVCLDAGCTRTLPFFALHTQASQEGEYDGLMATLLAYADTVVPDGAPRVIMGDFNAWDTLTDPHVCVPSYEPGVSHQEGIRRIISSGYTDMMRLKNPAGNVYTGMLNRLPYNQTQACCTIAAGLPQGHPYKAIDHAYSKHLADGQILSAQRFGIPVGGYGNCAASDHLGIKISVTIPPPN